MKDRLSMMGCVLALSALIASGCGSTIPQPAPTSTAVPTEDDVGLANPASAYCEEQGYTLEIRTDEDGGQYGVCVFPDGSECEEWAFYRGECGPGAEEAEEATEVHDPRFARDTALAAMREHHAEQAPAPDLAWTEEDVTPEGLVGSSTFQYTAGDWVIKVTFPLAAPEATVYRVKASNQATGFVWEGEVDGSGEVTEQAVGEAPDVTYEGIQFSYDDGIADEVVADIVPAVNPEDAPEWGVVPEHIRFAFSGYLLPDTFHEPRIIVYPVGDFEAISETATKVVADLQQLLADEPEAPEAIPILPVFNAGQMMLTQVAYVDFQNGAGVRFLTQYGQAYVPINNRDVFYTFQGLTDDGSYYVTAILPVAHPSLPPDETEIPGGDFEAFAENFEAYAAEIEQQLNAQEGASFTPDLTLLDAMIESLEVTPTSLPR